jgi:O-antigen ligase
MPLPESFLKRKINFLMVLAVVATTVFSWYNQNSWCIILLVLCRLVDGGPVRAIRAAFTNRFFLAFLAFVLVDAAGLIYTHNLHAGGSVLSKESSLVAIAFVLCGGRFADDQDYRALMTGYCGILAAACVYCLAKAGMRYSAMPVKDISVFFYHPLSGVIGQNAVFFSVYMIFGLIFLLYHPIYTGPLPKWFREPVQLVLVLFFIGIIILLSSKLLLIVLFLLLLSFVLMRYIARRNYLAIVLVAVGGLMLTMWIVFTDNPIKRRYQDLEHGDINMAKQATFTDSTVYNGAQIRLIQWRDANQIMREHQAWVFGVTSGDSQDLLNDKYRQAKMFMGRAGTKQRGFTDFNFHNQYIETTVRMGFLGLAALLYICLLMIELTVRRRTVETAFTALTLLSICTVESLLTLQHGVFAFVFMPLMLLYSPKKGPVAKLSD